MTFKNDIFILRCSLILKISIILTEGETFHMREFYKSEVEEIFAAKKKIFAYSLFIGNGSPNSEMRLKKAFASKRGLNRRKKS